MSIDLSGVAGCALAGWTKTQRNKQAMAMCVSFMPNDLGLSA